MSRTNGDPEEALQESASRLISIDGAVIAPTPDYQPGESEKTLQDALKGKMKPYFSSSKLIDKGYLIWGTRGEEAQRVACVGVELLKSLEPADVADIVNAAKQKIGSSCPDTSYDFIVWPHGCMPKICEGASPFYSKYSWWSLPAGKYVIIDLGTDETPYEIIDGSVYAYFLVQNIWAISLAILIVAFQIALFVLLWNDNNEKSTAPSSLSDTEEVVGFVFAMILLSVRLLPKIGQALALINTGRKVKCHKYKEGEKKYNLRQSVALIVVGICELGVAGWCYAIGIRVSLNTTTTLTRMITNAVVALWVEAVDEHVYLLLKFYSKPSWYKHYKAELENEYGPPKTEALSESEIKTLKKKLANKDD